LSILVVTIGAIFLAGKPQTSLGQQNPPPTTGREFACGCFVCYGLVAGAYEVFDDGKTTAGKPCTGILAEDACPAEMAQLPDKGKSFCAKVKNKYKFSSFKDSCPMLASACQPFEKQPPPEPKAEKPADPNPTPEPLSVGSVATGGDPVEVTIMCPLNVHSISVNWQNDVDGSYSDAGGGGGTLDFNHYGGSERMDMRLFNAYRSGQKIICEYNLTGTTGGQFHPHVSYEYKVKREIISCFKSGHGMKCKVKP